MGKRLFPVIVLLSLFSGCIGMNQTHLKKDQYGDVTWSSEPIEDEYESPEDYSPHEIAAQKEDNAGVQPVTDAQPPGYTPEGSPSPDTMEQSTLTGSFFRLAGFEANIVRTEIVHPYTTHFKSSSFSDSSWDSKPEVTGTGYEYDVYIYQDKKTNMLAGGGAFKSRLKRNSKEENGIYVDEITRTEGYWIYASGKHNPYSWLYVQASIGLFYYKLKTDINTNAPVYTYDGLSGRDLLGLWGIGGGMETPWNWPFHLFAGIRFWLPFNDYSDYGAVQVNAGISYRF